MAGRSDIGKVRSPNEDRYAIRTDLPDGGALCVVADGMGGYASGEVAATMAVEQVLLTAKDGVGLAAAVAAANSNIYQRSLTEATHRGMGTTVTCVHIHDGQAQFVHVGDSRMYLIRDGQVRQLTTDHSWVAEEVRAGRLTAEEAHRSTSRNLITRALGLEPEVVTNTGACPLVAGDALLLCSDGVHTLVSADELAQACAHSAAAGSDALIESVLARGAPDNATVVIAKLVGDGPTVPRAAVTRPLPDIAQQTASGRPTAPTAIANARPANEAESQRRRRPALRMIVLVIAALVLAAVIAAVIFRVGL